MKLRYMVEYALRDRIREPRYEPVGIWVQGPGPGLDLVIEFLPGNTEAREEAEWIINRLVENDIRTLLSSDTQSYAFRRHLLLRTLLPAN